MAKARKKAAKPPGSQTQDAAAARIQKIQRGTLAKRRASAMKKKSPKKKGPGKKKKPKTFADECDAIVEEAERALEAGSAAAADAGGLVTLASTKRVDACDDSVSEFDSDEDEEYEVEDDEYTTCDGIVVDVEPGGTYAVKTDVFGAGHGARVAGVQGHQMAWRSGRLGSPEVDAGVPKGPSHLSREA